MNKIVLHPTVIFFNQQQFNKIRISYFLRREIVRVRFRQVKYWSIPGQSYLLIQDRSGPTLPWRLSVQQKNDLLEMPFSPVKYVAWRGFFRRTPKFEHDCYLLTTILPKRMRAILSCYDTTCYNAGFNADFASGWSSVRDHLAFYLFSWSRTRHGFIAPTEQQQQPANFKWAITCQYLLSLRNSRLKRYLKYEACNFFIFIIFFTNIYLF